MRLDMFMLINSLLTFNLLSILFDLYAIDNRILTSIPAKNRSINLRIVPFMILKLSLQFVVLFKLIEKEGF